MDVEEKSGVITFFSSQHAIHAEKVLNTGGFSVELIPGPKDISPNCGVALRCGRSHLVDVEAALRQNNVLYEAVHEYYLAPPKSIFKKFLGR